MATTMLPFLYQTRTIQQVSRTTPARNSAIFRSLLHATASRHFRAGATAHQKSSTSDPIPFELPPDLASDPEFNPQAAATTGKDAPTEDDLRKRYGTITPTERRAFESIFKEIANRSSSALPASAFEPAVPGRDRSVATTIIADATQERTQLGTSLLEHMRELHRIDPTKSGAKVLSAEERYEALLRFPPSLRSAARTALGLTEPVEQEEIDLRDVIGDGFGVGPDGQGKAMDEAMAGISAAFGGSGPSPESEGVQEREPVAQPISRTHVTDAEDSVIHRVPWPMQDPLKDTSYTDPLTQKTALERQRYGERTRVWELMNAAQTDFQLWDVLEKEVFTMVARLGFGPEAEPAQAIDGKPSKAVKKSRRGRKKKNPQAAVEEPAPSSLDSPLPHPPELDIDVHGPLYPTFLVHAMELISGRFPRSPYALAILPRVKSLGLVSYVLGASPEFYAEMAGFLWYRHNDAEAVLELYEEMRHAGLFFDRSHLNLLYVMLAGLRSCGAGERGEFRLGLMATPEWTPILGSRLLHWIRAVQVDIAKRQADGPAQRTTQPPGRSVASGIAL